MADARALLRAERASRRITHPHAAYTSDGKLLCNLCNTPVKSEKQWQSHLHSTQHNLRSQRQQDVAASRGAGSEAGPKKRKAESLESPPQERKKAKAEPALAEAEESADVSKGLAVHESAAQSTEAGSLPNGTGTKSTESKDIDPDDIAAFERELASLEASAAQEEEFARQRSIRNAATISAAPLTAEELAAQAREEQSAQRGKRDVELEEEREDAARVLEDEMEEMEGLEERVRKLRERREKLRGPGSSTNDNGGTVEDREGDAAGKAHEEDSDDEDDDEDFDEWKFGGS